MSTTLATWPLAPWLVVAALLLVPAGMPVVRAEGPPRLSLDYTVTPGAYDNAVRVASVTELLYPRIAVDHDPESAGYGAVYVIGTGDWSCGDLVVVRSLDGGRTFEPPRRSAVCLDGPSVDVALGRNGTLYAVGWGPVVLRSTDGGIVWSVVATLDTAAAPASVAVDPVTDAVFVAWGPSDDPWRFLPGAILVASSRDGGGNWTAPVDALKGVSQGARPQIAAHDGRIVASLVADTSSNPAIAAVASSDAGANWGNLTALSPQVPWLCLSNPSAAASRSGIFAVSWSEGTASDCGDDWGNSTAAYVALSRDGGGTFTGPVRAGGPPGWAGPSLGDAVVFDDASRLYIAWHSIAPGWTSASVYVANSTDLGSTFEQDSFTTRLRAAGGNATAQENLAAGPEGRVYLVWEAVDPFVGPDNPETGIFVRTIAGEAVGDIALDEQLSGPLGIEIRDPATNATLDRLPWTGSPVSAAELPPGTYAVWLRSGGAPHLAGEMPVRTWGLTRFTVLVGEVPGGTPFPWVPALALAAGVGIVSAALAGLHYTRLRREDVLQRKVRLLVFEHIRNNPGASFTAVRDALGLQNGVAAYHLSVLEKQGLVHAEARRRHRWYYPNGDVSLWRNLPLSPLQASLLQAVRRSPGIGIRELARAVGRRASSVMYNVKALAREGVLRSERTGPTVRWYPTDEGGAGRRNTAER